MDNKQLSEQRLDRIMKAVRHEKPDRTPLQLIGNIAFLKYVDPESKIVDYVRDPVGCMKKVIAGFGHLKNIDAINGAGIWAPTVGAFWLSKSKIPGRELGDDDLWQIDEQPFMTREDYDVIIDKGFKWFKDDVLFNKLGYSKEELDYSVTVMKEISQLFADAGYADPGGGFAVSSVINDLTSGRGTVNFFRDMRQIPDKVRACIDVMLEEQLADLAKSLEGAREGMRGVVAPALRCTCDFVSEEFFEKNVWKTMYTGADMMIEAGLHVNFHNDSNWTDFLHFYKRFPPKTCIFDSDGQTDIYKIREILGDRMCLTGNVSPALLTLGSPDEVYDFCRKQIEEMGDAYILSGSCALPPNTKPENIDAMNAAAAG